jgi:F-type H+-transporting ATPase subunit delta
MATADPMTASVAGRYASALFELAKEEGQLARIEEELGEIAAMLDESEDLRRLIRSPVIAADDQARALSALLARAGISGLTANFLRLVAAKRRLFVARDMIRAFRLLAARDRGEVSAEVISAHPLTGEQKRMLLDTLKASLGKAVDINAKVDANLLGGLIVKIGSRMIDSSLRTKLNNLKIAMKGLG